MLDFEKQLEEMGEYGVVFEVQHPLVKIAGLPHVNLYEMVLFESGEMGEVFSLERESIQVIVFSNTPVRVGMRVTRKKRFVTVPVGPELFGTVIDPLGNFLSESTKKTPPLQAREVDIPPPGISHRARIKRPFLTGVSIVDMMLPLGFGQKQLVIGDRKAGKTSFLFTAIKNQVKRGSVAVYAAIARRKSDVKYVQNFFERENLSSRTVIVATTSYDSPSLIFLAPYSAMTIAEYFRDQGQDVLLVLDDLSSHARFYREVSLIAKRFPGRDSYPGDIFYIHARLLERAGNFKHKEKGEVAITVLPVAEIIEGDFTGYIATNIMGMTDGHIFFDGNIYNRGRRPAINVALSVTRVGRQTQTKVLQDINHQLTSLLALYDKMQNLSHFGAELTDTVKHILKTGEMIYRFFDQPYDFVIPQEVQLVLFSILWLEFFPTTSTEEIHELRKKLTAVYADQKVATLFQNLIKAESFDSMLGKIAAQKEFLLSICKTNAQ